MAGLKLARHTLGLVVLELDVEAILDANFHFDGGVHLRLLEEREAKQGSKNQQLRWERAMQNFAVDQNEK